MVDHPGRRRALLLALTSAAMPVVLLLNAGSAYASGAVVVDVSDATQWATQPISDAVPVEAITSNPAEVSALEALYALNPGDATADDAMKPVTMTSDALNGAEAAGEATGFETGELAPVAADGALLAPVAVAVAGFYAGWKIGKWLGGLTSPSSDANCDSSAPSGQCIQGGGSAPAIVWGGIVSHQVWSAHGSFYLTGVVGHAYDAAGYTPSVNAYSPGTIRSVSATWTNRCSGSSGIVSEHQDFVDVPGSDAIHFDMSCSQSSAILLSTTVATTTAVETSGSCNHPGLTMADGSTCSLTNGGLVTVDTPGAFTVEWDSADDPDGEGVRTLTYQQECVDNSGVTSVTTDKVQPFQESDGTYSLNLPACPLGQHRLEAKVFDDPRLGGKLVAEMNLPDEDANPARQALTSTGATPQPLSGTDPDYGDCTWDGVAVKSVDCKKIKTPAPTDDPTPSPTPSASPDPDAGDGTGPGGVPSGSKSPTDSCFPSGWGWFNPVSWIEQPVKCALQWAFVPDASALDQVSDLESDFSSRPPGSIITGAVTTVGSMVTSYSGGSSCSQMPDFGPDTQPIGGPTIRLPCSPPGGIGYEIVYGVMQVALVVGTGLATWSLVSRALGGRSDG